MPNITLPRLQPIQGYAVANKAASLAPRVAPAGVSALGSSVARAGSVSGLGASMLFSPVLGALIAGGTALLGQYLQNKASLSAEQRARAYALQDRLHDELYNSPALQKLRLEQAGLSPAEYVQQFETSSQTPEVQVPDFSMLAGAGGSALSGAYSAISAQSDLRKMSADIRLLEAEADSKRAEADSARKRYDLEIANKTLENSKLGKDISLVQLAIQGSLLDNKGKSIANDSALLEYVFDRDTKQFRMEAIQLANEASKLDNSQKQFALELAQESKDLQVQLLSGQVEGVKLENDLKTLNIQGKKYEIDNILPAELTALNDKHNLSEDEHKQNAEKLQLLVYAVHKGKMQDKLATGEYNAIVEKWNKYVKLVQRRLDLDYKTADIVASGAAARAMFGQRSGYVPIIDTVLDF